MGGMASVWCKITTHCKPIITGERARPRSTYQMEMSIDIACLLWSVWICAFYIRVNRERSLLLLLYNEYSNSVVWCHRILYNYYRIPNDSSNSDWIDWVAWSIVCIPGSFRAKAQAIIYAAEADRAKWVNNKSAFTMESIDRRVYLAVANCMSCNWPRNFDLNAYCKPQFCLARHWLCVVALQLLSSCLCVCAWCVMCYVISNALQVERDQFGPIQSKHQCSYYMISPMLQCTRSGHHTFRLHRLSKRSTAKRCIFHRPHIRSSAE